MPLVNKEATKKLQEIFHRPGMTIVPGGTLPWHAVLTERAGYEAFYISGGMSHRWLLGKPDSGQLTMTEFWQNAKRIVKTVDIPVISDADTGGGTAVNAYRTVKEYIWAGLAGCHIEDVQHPKGVTTKGQVAGRVMHDRERLISIEEAVGKLKAAVAAKRELDRNFVIIGRTDARNGRGGGYEEAIKRGKAYEKIPGVDVIMFDHMQTWEEAAQALQEIKKPCFHAVAFFATRDADGNIVQRYPMPSLEERERAGEKIYLGVALSIGPANQAAWEMLVDFKERGTQVIEDWRNDVDKKPREMQLPADLGRREFLLQMYDKYLPKPPRTRALR